MSEHNKQNSLKEVKEGLKNYQEEGLTDRELSIRERYCIPCFSSMIALSTCVQLSVSLTSSVRKKHMRVSLWMPESGWFNWVIMMSLQRMGCCVW